MEPFKNDKYSGGWNNPVAPRKGFRQEKTSKHRRQQWQRPANIRHKKDLWYINL